MLNLTNIPRFQVAVPEAAVAVRELCLTPAPLYTCLCVCPVFIPLLPLVGIPSTNLCCRMQPGIVQAVPPWVLKVAGFVSPVCCWIVPKPCSVSPWSLPMDSELWSSDSVAGMPFRLLLIGMTQQASLTPSSYAAGLGS